MKNFPKCYINLWWGQQKEETIKTSASIRNHQLLFVCSSYKFCICTLLPRFSKGSAMINLTIPPYCYNIVKNFYIYIIYNIYIKDTLVNKIKILTSRNIINAENVKVPPIWLLYLKLTSQMWMPYCQGYMKINKQQWIFLRVNWIYLEAIKLNFKNS